MWENERIGRMGKELWNKIAFDYDIYMLFSWVIVVCAAAVFLSSLTHFFMFSPFCKALYMRYNARTVRELCFICSTLSLAFTYIPLCYASVWMLVIVAIGSFCLFHIIGYSTILSLSPLRLIFALFVRCVCAMEIVHNCSKFKVFFFEIESLCVRCMCMDGIQW